MNYMMRMRPLLRKHCARLEKEYGITHEQQAYMLTACLKTGRRSVPDWLIPPVGVMIEYAYGRKPIL